jgi:DNA-3-methyladenine glycosylase II
VERSSFTVSVKPPFRLDLTVWALRRREINQIDRWDGLTYRRTLHSGTVLAELAVTQVGSAKAPRLHVQVTGAKSRRSHLLARKTLSRMLGLEIDLTPFYLLAKRDARLSALVDRFRGMRPPRVPTIFEALVNAIACQQLSLQVGLILLNRLAARYGQSSLPEAGPAFPRPVDLASATRKSLRSLGFSRSKGFAIIELGSAIARRKIDLDVFEHLDDASVQEELENLRGIGRWTSEYVLLRGFGRLNIFPGDDVGARNSLRRWLRLRNPLDYQRTKAILQRWQPYGGLVYLHLLLNGLFESGAIR